MKRINRPYKIIGFHSNQLCERGTETALYDYAYFNQKIYGNKSVIFYCKNNDVNVNSVIEKFEREFTCYAYDEFNEVDKIIVKDGIDYLYIITDGERKNKKLSMVCPNLVHCVFQVDPYCDRYATVSKYLSNKWEGIVDYVPHMINLPTHHENMRKELNIPSDAIVLGRYGGYDQFNIYYVLQTIAEYLNQNRNIYFLFANTQKFYEHSNIIYLDKIIDLHQKVKFINTCDGMIHARRVGETFGLSIGEFSTLNKPVITCISKTDNAHIDILHDKAILYHDSNSLMNIFKNIEKHLASKKDWNAFTEFTPEKVMERFMRVYKIIEEPYDIVFYSKLNNNRVKEFSENLIKLGKRVKIYENLEIFDNKNINRLIVNDFKDLQYVVNSNIKVNQIIYDCDDTNQVLNIKNEIVTSILSSVNIIIVKNNYQKNAFDKYNLLEDKLLVIPYCIN